MTIGIRYDTAFSTIAKARRRDSKWPGHLAFVLGLLLPVLVRCAAISVSLSGPGFSVPPHEYGGLSSGIKKTHNQTLPLAFMVAELGSGWCEESRGVSIQPGWRPGRGDWGFIRKIIFLIHGWMMYLYQIKQIQAQKQCYQRIIK